MLDLKKKVTVPAHILHKDLNGEGVILNLETEAYFGMDTVANRMFVVLSSTDSIEAAYNVLQNEYDIDPATLRRDIQEFIGKLVKYGMVKLVE